MIIVGWVGDAGCSRLLLWHGVMRLERLHHGTAAPGGIWHAAQRAENPQGLRGKWAGLPEGLGMSLRGVGAGQTGLSWLHSLGGNGMRDTYRQ